MAAQLLPSALTYLGLLLLATMHQAGVRELVAASLAVLLTQVLPGVALWRLVRPAAGWWVEDLFMGFACGAALAVPAQITSVATGLPFLAWAVPLGLLGALALVPASRRRIRRAECGRLPGWWGLLVAIPALPVAVDAWRFFSQPLRWKGWAAPYEDLPYHLALAGELSHRWPPHYPQVAAEPLHYHWFSHAWMAQVGSVSGAPLDVVLLRFLPVMMAVSVPVCLATAAMRLSGHAGAGPLAVVFCFFVTELDVWRLPRDELPVNPLSPSEGFGALLLLPVVVLVVFRWRRTVSPLSVLLLLPLAVAAGGAKGSVLPILLAGCALASVCVVVDRAAVWRLVVFDTVLIGGVFWLLMATLFGGGNGAMSPTPLTSLANVRGNGFVGDQVLSVGGVIAVTLLTLAAMMLPLLAAAGVGLEAAVRRDPTMWMLVGSAAAGLGAVVVLAHPGGSQLYFLRTAVLPMALLAAWGAALLLGRVGRPAVLIAAVAMGIAWVLAVRLVAGPVANSDAPLRAAWGSLAVFLAGVLAGSAVIAWAFDRYAKGDTVASRTRILTTAAVALLAAACVALPGSRSPLTPPDRVTARTAGAFHSGQVAAARYIRSHAHWDDLVMTNRHCRGRSGPGCDTRRFFVAAYTELRALVEGWGYTRRANALDFGTDAYSPRHGPFWDPQLLTLNDRFFVAPTPEDARWLYAQGVRWVFVDHTGPSAAETLESVAVEEFRTATATVYSLRRSQP